MVLISANWVSEAFADIAVRRVTDGVGNRMDLRSPTTRKQPDYAANHADLRMGPGQKRDGHGHLLEPALSAK